MMRKGDDRNRGDLFLRSHFSLFVYAHKLNFVWRKIKIGKIKENS